MTICTRMNEELYGHEPPCPADIMDYRKHKRPPPFERLVRVRSWVTCLGFIASTDNTTPLPAYFLFTASHPCCTNFTGVET